MLKPVEQPVFAPKPDSVGAVNLLFPVVDRFLSQETDATTPITDILVKSLITNLSDGQRVATGQLVEVRGIAWDAGYGIQMVEVSTDEGRSWRAAELDTDHGRFSFRGFRHAFKALRTGRQVVLAKATNRMGSSQPFELIFNPAGYHNNVVSRVTLRVT